MFIRLIGIPAARVRTVSSESERIVADPGEAQPEILEEHFRLLIDSLTDYAVFMIDLSGKISSWNPGVERLLGYTAEEFVGLGFDALFVPEDVALGRPA